MDPEPARDRLMGWAAVTGAALLVAVPPLAPLPVLGAFVAARVSDRRGLSATRDRWSSALPDAIDLFSLTLGSGLTVPSALGLVGPRCPAPVGPALVEADTRFRHGEPLLVALDRVGDAGAPARPLVSILLASHLDGAPVGEPLARLGAQLREELRRTAEARARQVPVRMLFPLVLCTLPAFVLVTVVPPVLAALGDIGT